MYIPEGLTEQQVIDIMTKVANEKCRDYLFGVNSPEDMKQQAIQFCMEAINKRKFVPRDNGKSVEAQLLNFLRVHARNKLSNYRRNISCRYSNPNNKNNFAKYAIQHPLKIYSQDLEHSELFAIEYDIEGKIDRASLVDELRESLPQGMENDFETFLAGEKLSKTKTENLLTHLRSYINAKKEHDNTTGTAI